MSETSGKPSDPKADIIAAQNTASALIKFFGQSGKLSGELQKLGNEVLRDQRNKMEAAASRVPPLEQPTISLSAGAIDELKQIAGGRDRVKAAEAHELLTQLASQVQSSEAANNHGPDKSSSLGDKPGVTYKTYTDKGEEIWHYD